jgi:hypothetical protein
MNKYEDLEHKIINSYTEGVTISEAEALAAEFLHAMITLSNDLKNTDLDVRMRKVGTKAIKAQVYLEEAAKGAKKPSDSMLAALIDHNDLVKVGQKEFDEAEAKKEHLERLFAVFKEAHVHYRGISKGRYD